MLYLQPAALFGGAERQAATTIPWLGELGIEVVAVAGPGPIIGEWFARRGITDFVHSTNFPGSWPKQRGLARLSLPRRYYQCLRAMEAEIERLVLERDIDVIFAALPFSWVAATPVARKLGVPIIWRAGGTEISSMEQRILSMWTTRWKPDLLLCNGGAVADTYGPLIGAPLMIVPNGVDTGEFHPLRTGENRFKPRAARITVGFAARLVAQKRPEDFIELAARIGARNPDVHFLVSGEGSMRPRYEELARARGASTLHFLGYVADMTEFYDACDIFVLPSRSEGCPNVVLEAMACGSAIVASDASGTREVVRDGIEGFVYPIGDVAALTSATLRMVDNEPLRRALVQRARRRIDSAFSIDACARLTSDLAHGVARARGVELPAAGERSRGTGGTSPAIDLAAVARAPIV